MVTVGASKRPSCRTCAVDSLLAAQPISEAVPLPAGRLFGLTQPPYGRRELSLMLAPCASCPLVADIRRDGHALQDLERRQDQRAVRTEQDWRLVQVWCVRPG